MTVGLVRMAWSGTSGGPGLSQWAVVSATGGSWSSVNAKDATDAARALAVSMAAFLPDELQLQVLANVDLYDEKTGTLTGTATASPAPLNVTPTSAATYAGGVGAKVDFNTGVIRNGHRVVGHTYWVPLISTVYDNSGTLGATQMSTITTAHTTFIAALASKNLGLQVWSRPKQQGDGTGGLSSVVSASIKDKTAFLRGRRD